MPRSLRVLLDPLRLEEGDDTRLLLDGALVRFSRRGQGTSAASIDSPATAKITLEMTFLDRARNPTDIEQRTLATLEGKLVFRNANTPVFSSTIDDDEPKGLVVDQHAEREAPEGATSRRVLRFEFGSPDFENVPKAPQELVVKLDPRRFPYMEVRAKLEIAGSVEADFDVNDVLDIAITPSNPRPLVEGASIGIHPPLFDEIPPHATLVVTPSAGDPVTFALDSGTDRGDGLLSFTVEDPKPGVLYTAEMRIQTFGPGTVLFQDVELYQLVVESEGTAPAPLSTSGSDALVFESPPAEPPADEAVEGGPGETSDEQLAALGAQAGTVALA